MRTVDPLLVALALACACSEPNPPPPTAQPTGTPAVVEAPAPPGAARPGGSPGAQRFGAADLATVDPALERDATASTTDEALALRAARRFLHAAALRNAPALAHVTAVPFELASDAASCTTTHRAADAQALAPAIACITGDAALAAALAATLVDSTRVATRADVTPFAGDDADVGPGTWTLTEARDARTQYLVLVRVEGLARGPRVRRVVIVRQALADLR